MALLAYCIIEERPEVRIPDAGIGRTKITTVHLPGMECLVSSFDPKGQTGKEPIQEAALEFNRVLRELLLQTAVIPFRFPTIVADEKELSSVLVEHEGEYRIALSRLRDAVQMEIRVDFRRAEAGTISAPQSGTEYLRSRQAQHHRIEQAAAQFRQAAEPYIKDWRQRLSTLGAHCYALVARNDTENFLSQMKSLSLAPDYVARVTGPWPATQFLKDE